jgi:c-di-GMP phosphodiesterase
MQARDTELIPELPPEMVYVGRQPILDRNQQIYGYELLYRSESGGPGAEFDGDHATAMTALNSFVEFGMHRLVGSHRVFINLTRIFFTNKEPLLFNKQRLVLEVLEDIELDAEVIAGVRAMHESGYMVALDDFKFESRWDPLLPYCSIIKVEVTELDLNHFAPQIHKLKSRGIKLLAEKVETREVFDQARQLGFDLFQGYFFSKPEVLSTTRLQSNQIILLKMIALINDPRSSIADIAELVNQDAKLSFKILRFINTAAIGLPQKVDSIKQAVVHIGLQRLRTWSNLFIMAGLSNRAPAILITCLVRAEFCRLLAQEFDTCDPESGYTIGLFSLLDAMLNQPMQELVKDMPLPAEMLEALLSKTGNYSHGLKCVIALEQGIWREANVPMLSKEKINTLYCNAMIKADDLKKLLGSV